jgi:hypothetical protein
LQQHLDPLAVHERLQFLSKSAGAGRRRFTWRNLARPVAATVAFPFLLIGAYYVDTRLFPVIAGAPAIVVESAGPDQTVVRLAMNKLRGCEYKSLNFYLKGSFTESIKRLDDHQSSTRPVGRHLTAALVLQVSTRDFLERGQVITEHQCHPLWKHTKRIFG